MEDKPCLEAELNLVDIVLTNDPFTVRDCRKIDDF